MTLIKKLLLFGVPTVAVGGTGIGILVSRSRSRRAVSPANNVVVPEQRERIKEAGLDCGDAETDCTILTEGLNVDRDNKKGTYVLADGDNGKIRFRLSDDSIYKDKLRFTITEKPITLKNKSNDSETITLERYENYGLVKDESSGKVYLTRKLTAEQWIKKSLGLPDGCNIPTTVSSEPPTSPTCELTKDQIKLVDFDGKKEGGATVDWGNVELYIQKVSDEATYKGGYKFIFKPKAELNINTDYKIISKVRKEFRLKDPDADDLVLEMVWRNESELLKKVGLSCGEKDKCTVEDGALKIKVNGSFIEDGKRKSGDGATLYLEARDSSDYYEGLSFSAWGGEITIESTASTDTTIKMEELGIYYIVKEDKNGSPTYHLTKKNGGVEDMIKHYLGVGECPPSAGSSKTCSTSEGKLKSFKFHDGEGEREISNANDHLNVTITVSSENKSTYPFGYKYSIDPHRDIKVGSINITRSGNNYFKIKKDVENKKLYLEKVK